MFYEYNVMLYQGVSELKLKNLLISKFVCLSVVYCFFSWASYFNNTNSMPTFMSSLAYYSYAATCKFYAIEYSVFNGDILAYDASMIVSFVLSMAICMLFGIILSHVLYFLIRIANGLSWRRK